MLPIISAFRCSLKLKTHFPSPQDFCLQFTEPKLFKNHNLWLYSSSMDENSVSTIATASVDTPAKPLNYLMCQSCKTAYLADSVLKTKSNRVKCEVCQKEWFQTADKLMKVDEMTEIIDMKPEKIADVKRIINDNNWPKYPRVDKVGLFIGNLPYSYEEKDIIALFQEYGLVGVSLVKDADGLSKGFAFIEVTSESIAQKVVDEMHHFYTDSNRKLTVRLVSSSWLLLKKFLSYFYF